MIKKETPVFETRVQTVDRVETTQVPAFTTQEKIVKVPEVINQVVVEKIEVPKIIEVERWNDKIIT